MVLVYLSYIFNKIRTLMELISSERSLNVGEAIIDVIGGEEVPWIDSLLNECSSLYSLSKW